jgi:DNA-binding NtrC family response regulator/pSer/pThr/pTyr-binding forkhead associated (FHA) protein
MAVIQRRNLASDYQAEIERRNARFEGVTWELPSTLQEPPLPESARRSLVIVGPDGVQTIWLEQEGTLTIGRSPENGIAVDDPAISRTHAAVHVGSEVELEDLRSANGTRLCGKPLASGERRVLAPGDTFELGATIVVYQRMMRAPRKKLYPHSVFEARLEEECAQRVKRSPFAVVRIEVGGDLTPEQIQAALTADLKSNDVIASYAPDQVEILLLETIRPAAEKIVDAMLRRLGSNARAGLAFHPEHGISAGALISAATAALSGEEQDGSKVVIADPAMRELYRVVDRVAQGSIAVLLLGETGAGKEVVAEAIHRRSPRRERPFLRLNCAALSEHIVESELFGHEKGAFTGAERAKAGLLETAAGGTLFLDEVGELPLVTQAKLLRAIEQREVLRVGAVSPRAIDVRFVSATNRDLEAEVERGRFRRDLYYRLNGAVLSIPPLRERTSEIEPLAQLFLDRAARELGLVRPPSLAFATIELMRAYSWPGNIRELRNAIDRAVLLSGDVIEPIHLPFEKISASWPDRSKRLPLSPEEEAHRARIIAALEQCAGNQTRAAEVLGVARQTLSKWLTRYGFPRPRKGHGD